MRMLGGWTHFIQILSADTRATQGRRTLAASFGNSLLSQDGSETSQKSRGLFFSLYSRLLSRSCSANASFCTSCSMKSALATTAYQVACTSPGVVKNNLLLTEAASKHVIVQAPSLLDLAIQLGNRPVAVLLTGGCFCCSQ